MKSLKFLGVVALLSVVLVSCDDSQGVVKDNDIEGENLIKVLIHEIDKGTVDAYGLDASEYKDVAVDGNATRVIPISTLIREVAGISGNDLSKYTCNYESRIDGFRPSDKGDRCAPLSCAYSDLSYIDVNTGNLIYDDKFPVSNMPGCYHVKDLGKILLTEVGK